MLLGVEFPWVETPCVTERSELPRREDGFQQFSSGESEQLSDISRDRDTGLTNAEELVDKPSLNERISKCTPRVPSAWQGSME